MKCLWIKLYDYVFTKHRHLNTYPTLTHEKKGWEILSQKRIEQSI